MAHILKEIFSSDLSFYVYFHKVKGLEMPEDERQGGELQFGKCWGGVRLS